MSRIAARPSYDQEDLKEWKESWYYEKQDVMVFTSALHVPELRGSRSILEGPSLAGYLAAGIRKAECLALLAARPVHRASHERGGGWFRSSVKELVTLIVKLTCTHLQLSVAVRIFSPVRHQ